MIHHDYNPAISGSIFRKGNGDECRHAQKVVHGKAAKLAYRKPFEDFEDLCLWQKRYEFIHIRTSLYHHTACCSTIQRHFERPMYRFQPFRSESVRRVHVPSSPNFLVIEGRKSSRLAQNVQRFEWNFAFRRRDRMVHTPDSSLKFRVRKFWRL